jgi:hypothetical protein
LSQWFGSADPDQNITDLQHNDDLDSVVVVPVLRIRDVYPGSRILILTHPGSRIPDLGSRIPDPKTATKERGEKKLVVIPFYVATNFTKL